MARSPCCKEGLNRGAWTAMEDKILIEFIKTHGEGKWSKVSERAGIRRCGKSCRLRWLNYLRPNIKRGNISQDEEDLIIRLHKLLGNRWSLIAGRLPERTDNEIKNYWKSKISKKVQGGHHPTTNWNHRRLSTIEQSAGLSPPEPQKTQTKPAVATLMINDFASDDTALTLDNPSDFMMDLETDERILSDLLNTDFAALPCNEGVSTSTNTNDTNYSSLNSSPTLLF